MIDTLRGSRLAGRRAAGLALALVALGACGGGDGAVAPPPPPTGTLRVNVAGLPDGGGGLVELENGAARYLVARDTTLATVPVGTYRVTPRPVLVDGQAYADTVAQQVVVAAGQFAVAQVQYRLRPTTVRVVVTGVADPASITLPFVDSLGRTQAVLGSSILATGRVTALRSATYQVAIPRVDGRTAVFGVDSARRTVVVPAGGEAVLTLAYRQVSGRLTVQFPEVGGVAVAATVRDSAGVTLGRVTAAAPTLEKVIEGPVQLVPDVVVLSGGFQLRPAMAVETVRLIAGQTATASVRYVPVPPAGFNVRVAAVDVVQAAHSLSGPLPLVARREALVRVTVLANGENFGLQPSVDVEVRAANGVSRTFRATAARPVVPTVAQPDSLTSTWNVVLPSEVVGAGMAVRARLVPDAPLAQDPPADNVFPQSGAIALDVRAVRPLTLVFIPIEVNGTAFVPTAAQVTSWTGSARAMLPIGEVTTRVAASLNVGASRPNAVADSLTVRRRRALADSSEIWIGLVPGLSGGLGSPDRVITVGVDPTRNIPTTLSHELGHVFGFGHAPSCDAAGIHPLYPYADGRNASWGWNSQENRVLSAGTFDIMGYCGPQWISDFAWRTMLLQRTSGGIYP